MKSNILVCTLFVSTILALAVNSAIAGTIINVPADQPTIQAGINAAASGDTVLVAPGTYKENINFKWQGDNSPEFRRCESHHH